MENQVHIRNAEPSDAPIIIEFNQNMARETEDKELSTEIITNGVTKIFADSECGFYIVAENESREVVACLLVTKEWSDWRDAWFWWIQSVYVRVDSRGKGVYRQMYDFVRNIARERGDVCGFRLYVEKENVIAQKTYEKLGMHETVYKMYEEVL